MKKTKQFSFYLKNDLRERLEKKTKFGVTLAHLINRAIELQLNRDDELEKNIKTNEALYGPSNPPEDLGETVKEFVK
jgi:predicted DNA-binding protein